MISGCKRTQIPASITSLGDCCFAGCSSLTSIKIPTSVTSLGEKCFHSCSSLTSIVIPTSIKTLKFCCFYGCESLTSIVIPASVTDLEEDCFMRCFSLKTIICKMKKIIKNRTLFINTPIDDATLYVPKEMLTLYKSIEPWSCFGTIRPLTK